MADFATLAKAMDAKVDDRLGDSILYKRPADADFLPLKAFLIFEEPMEGGYGSRDSAQGRVRLKVERDKVPAPSKSDRLQCPALLGAAIYRPIGNDPVTAGRYWLVDLQKV